MTNTSFSEFLQQAPYRVVFTLENKTDLTLSVIQGCHCVAVLRHQTRPSLAVVPNLLFHPVVTGGGYSNRAVGLCLRRICLAQPCLSSAACPAWVSSTTQHPLVPLSTLRHLMAPHDI